MMLQAKSMVMICVENENWPNLVLVPQISTQQLGVCSCSREHEVR